MKNYDELFKQEEKAIKIKEELKLQEKNAKSKIVIDFCEEHIFGFLDYLQNKFYVRKHGVNYRSDGKIYKDNIVESYAKNFIEYIKEYEKFECGINYKWSNGGISNTIKVTCVDYKPVLTYEGNVVTVDEFEKTVIKQIQESINKNSEEFKIINK